jgi:hypothetical protein
VKFVPPNFRCRVAEPDTPRQKYSRLVHAKNAAEARTWLEDRHYIVFKVQKYDFQKWIDAGKRLTAEAAKARGATDPKKRKAYEFKALWKPLKEILIDMFHGKCAYCDAVFAPVDYGDVEHFRPKAGVFEDPTHPGYYWLAYEPENYLPACQLCNRGGKGTHFPVSGQRAYRPTDSLAAELPDLLNPEDDVGKHLKFHPSTSAAAKAGRVEPRDPKDPRAMASIEFYKLNRPRLLEFRLKEQEQALQRYKQAWVNFILNKVKGGLDSFLESCESRQIPFAAAVIAEIEACAAELNLPPPFPRNGNTRAAKTASTASP